MNGMSTFEKKSCCEVCPYNISYTIWDSDNSTRTFSQESSQKKFQPTKRTASVDSQRRFREKKVVREEGLACSPAAISLGTTASCAGLKVKSQTDALFAHHSYEYLESTLNSGIQKVFWNTLPMTIIPMCGSITSGRY